jgi:hypothetical protein
MKDLKKQKGLESEQESDDSDVFEKVGYEKA